MLVVLAFAVLSVLSFFTKPLGWLKDFLFSAFGFLMYVMPVLIAFLFWVGLFHDITGGLVLKFAAILLILFALSGIIESGAGEGGGVLGRANKALFGKALGAVGSYIVNAFLIVIGFVMFTGFSFVERIRNERRLEEHR